MLAKERCGLRSKQVHSGCLLQTARSVPLVPVATGEARLVEGHGATEGAGPGGSGVWWPGRAWWSHCGLGLRVWLRRI